MSFAVLCLFFFVCLFGGFFRAVLAAYGSSQAGRLGVRPELQMPAYTTVTAIAMWNS